MEINQADTVWLLVSTALVLLMTPGLALFYGGMVSSRNVLSTYMHSFIALGVLTLQWVLFGYSLAFGGGNAFVPAALATLLAGAFLVLSVRRRRLA